MRSPANKSEPTAAFWFAAPRVKDNLPYSAVTGASARSLAGRGGSCLVIPRITATQTPTTRVPMMIGTIGEPLWAGFKTGWP